MPNFAKISAILRNILDETRVETGIDLITLSVSKNWTRPRRDRDETKVYPNFKEGELFQEIRPKSFSPEQMRWEPSKINDFYEVLERKE